MEAVETNRVEFDKKVLGNWIIVLSCFQLNETMLREVPTKTKCNQVANPPRDRDGSFSDRSI